MIWHLNAVLDTKLRHTARMVSVELALKMLIVSMFSVNVKTLDNLKSHILACENLVKRGDRGK